MGTSKRAAYELLIAAGLLLGSCDGPGLSQKQHDEVTDICDDSIGDSDAVSSLEGRVSELESRLNM